ncbi:hypothetical protein GGS26DRAFT_590830 [Hypomontagnella submonticulosa]|nr:hypothetical protein GGS26DRAFT_590830 [Hypomontagnella submonticulosa]
MAIIQHVLLATLGLSAGVFGTILPSFTTIAPNVGPTSRPCSEGTRTCDENYIYSCDASGQWEVREECVFPYSCAAKDNGTSDCVLGDSERHGGPTPTVTSIPAAFVHQSPVPHTGDRRCVGNVEEVYANYTGWIFVQKCSKCIDSHDGSVNCTPLVPTDPSANPTQAPSPAQTLSPFVDNPCFGGEVLCNGDRVEICTAERKWEDFGPCPGCKQLYNTRVKCNFDDSEADDFARRYVDELVRADPPPFPQSAKCNTGWEQCAENSTSIQVCDDNISWRTIKTCGSDELCLQILDGVAFCLDEHEAEAAKKEIANW